MLDDDTCEHCLSEHRMVFLVTPAIVSGHPLGDWVCERCDSRVATMMLMAKMQRVVEG